MGKRIFGSAYLITAKINQKFPSTTSGVSSGSGEESMDEEDACPQLIVPNFSGNSQYSQYRWLRWVSDLACIFESIMRGTNPPNVAAKEEHIARIWAENQWDHWQRSSDPV